MARALGRDLDVRAAEEEQREAVSEDWPVSPLEVSSSVGIALISVVLTSHLDDSPAVPGTEGVPGGPLKETDAAILHNTQPELFERLGIGAAYAERGIVDAASAFAQTYWVAWALVALTLVPAYFLPRKREATHLLDDEGLPPVVVH